MPEQHDEVPEIINAMLTFIEKHRSLDGFGLEPDEQRRMLQAAVTEGLILWNENRGRYELTRAAHKWLIKYSAARKARLNVAA